MDVCSAFACSFFNVIMVGVALDRLLCATNSQIRHFFIWKKKCVVKSISPFSCTQYHHQVSIELLWQEWKPLHLTDPGPIHIPGIQERAERLLSRFKGKPDRPPKVNTMHGHFMDVVCDVASSSFIAYIS